MRWGGKLIGAFLGLLFLKGPIGLLIGALVGHFFDMNLFSHMHAHQRQHQFRAGDPNSDVFFTSIFRLMGYLAKSDGQVTQAEINVAEQVMQNMSLSATLKQRAIALFQEGKQPQYNPDHAVQALRFKYGQQPTVLRMCHDILQQIARADGTPIPPQKATTLNQITRALGLMPFSFNFNDFDFSQFGGAFHQGRQSSHHYRRQTSHHTQQVNPYTVLGIPSTASNAEIKKRYRRLMSQYHPDKLVSQNLSDSEIAKATEKTQEIKSAYEQLKKERGI